MSHFILISWLITSLVVSLIAIHHLKASGEELRERSNIVMISLTVVFPALFILAAGVSWLLHLRGVTIRSRARHLIYRWENIHVTDGMDATVKIKDQLATMRDNAHSMTDEELKFLAGLSDDEFKLDKQIHDAIQDEIFERKVLR